MIFPGFDGGAEWGGAAFDPVSRRLYCQRERNAVGPDDGRATSRREAAAVARSTSASAPRVMAQTARATSSIPRADGSARTLHRNGAVHAADVRQWSHAEFCAPRLEPVELARGLHPERSPTRPWSQSSPSNAAADAVPPFITDGFHKLLDPDGYPGIEPPWGTLSAIDLDTGRLRLEGSDWRVPGAREAGAHDDGQRKLRWPGRDGRRSALHRRDGAGSKIPRVRCAHRRTVVAGPLWRPAPSQHRPCTRSLVANS